MYYYQATRYYKLIIINVYIQQLPAATNTHGSSNSTQYPKPATYGSGYGAYDTLNQSQDYTKGGYVGNTQAQKGSGANVSSTGSAGTDLSALYSKQHTALGKVNVSFISSNSFFSIFCIKNNNFISIGTVWIQTRIHRLGNSSYSVNMFWFYSALKFFINTTIKFTLQQNMVPSYNSTYQEEMQTANGLNARRIAFAISNVLSKK